jgi:hypothetical protein
MNDTAKLSNLGERSNLPSEGAGRTVDPDDWAGTRLAGGLNANLGGRDHVPIDVERRIVEWARRIFDFPAGASGVFVTGTSMANFMAIVTARTAALGGDALRSIATDSMHRIDAAALRDADADATNARIVADLHESGIAAPSSTTLDGKLAIRAAIVNHRTQPRDADAMVDAVLRFGAHPFAAPATR